MACVFSFSNAGYEFPRVWCKDPHIAFTYLVRNNKGLVSCVITVVCWLHLDNKMALNRMEHVSIIAAVWCSIFKVHFLPHYASTYFSRNCILLSPFIETIEAVHVVHKGDVFWTYTPIMIMIFVPLTSHVSK